jgi:DNA end-binding protein Ku
MKFENEAEYFEDILELKLSKEMLDLATHIITSKSGHFDPAQFEDRRVPSLICSRRKRPVKN